MTKVRTFRIPSHDAQAPDQAREVQKQALSTPRVECRRCRLRALHPPLRYQPDTQDQQRPVRPDEIPLQFASGLPALSDGQPVTQDKDFDVLRPHVRLIVTPDMLLRWHRDLVRR